MAVDIARALFPRMSGRYGREKLLDEARNWIVKAEWISRDDLDRFTSALHNPLLGRDARHAIAKMPDVENRMPRMSQDEAFSFLRGLMNRWLDWRFEQAEYGVGAQ
jgi:hypothetical protein